MDPRLLVVLAGVGCAAWLQGPAGENNADRRRNDFRYVPDPQLVRVMAGAHRSTTADIIWLRALPDMSREFGDTALKARWIDSALTSATDLEPTFMTVYDMGQAYLTHLDRRAKGAADRAIALLEKGIRENPDVAGLHVRLAMIYYIEKKDRAKTIEILRGASMLPGFDSFSAAMLTSLLANQRDDLIAIGYWAGLVEENQGELRRMAELNLWRTKERIATRAAIDFGKANGRPPATPQELVVPTLVQEGAIPVILDGLEIRADGRPHYPRCDELELESTIRSAEEWCRRFRDSGGRWPTFEENAHSGVPLPQAPAGRQWRFADGKVELVPAE